MKIAYNSAHIQTETLKIICSPSKPLLCISIFLPTSKKLLGWRQNIKLRNAHCRRDQTLSSGYSTSTQQCHMRPIRYSAELHCPILPPSKKKKFAPSLTGDVNPPQNSHWNNGRMKISCNSAYVQTETLNFTFAQQAIFVNFQLLRKCHAKCRM